MTTINQILQKLGKNFEIDIQAGIRGVEIKVYHINEFYRYMIALIVVRSVRITITKNDEYIEQENIKLKYLELYMWLTTQIEFETREVVHYNMHERTKNKQIRLEERMRSAKQKQKKTA